MKKLVLSVLILSSSSFIYAANPFFCDGNSLVKLVDGKEVREIPEGCDSVLKKTKHGYFCNGNTLYSLETGGKVRVIDNDDRFYNNLLTTRRGANEGGCQATLDATK